MTEALSKREKKQLVTWFRMMHFINMSNQLSNDFLKQYDLTLAQFDMLNQIYLHQPVTQKDLGDYLMISKGGVSQMLHRLEDNQLVCRERQWKEKYISLTEEGETLMGTLQLIQGKKQAAMFDSLTDDELAVFSKLMEKLKKDIMERGEKNGKHNN